jgi:hypothetical protein
MEELSPQLTEKFSRFSAALAGSGVRPEMITFDPEQDIERSVFYLG